jgi:hypothetical protein
MHCPSRKIVHVEHQGKLFTVTILNGKVKKIVLPYHRGEKLANGRVFKAYCERSVEPGPRFDAIAQKAMA